MLERNLVSPHFSMEELRCKCPCQIYNVNKLLIDGLESARTILGKPIRINSACRCPAHNAKVGGEKNSRHLTTLEHACEAADIYVPDMPADAVFKILWNRPPVQLKGFGLNVFKKFLHVDVRATSMTRWIYNEQGFAVPWSD